MRLLSQAKMVCCAGLAAALSFSPAVVTAQTVLFSDAFDSVSELVVFSPAGSPDNITVPVGTTGWTYQAANDNQNQAIYGSDYSAFNVPEAPNTAPGDTATSGVYMRANVSEGVVDQAGIFYEDASFTGRYQVKVDMYLSYAPDLGSTQAVGTTEHGGLFVGSDTASNPGSSVFPSSVGAGAIFSSDGDTAGFDHALLKNNVYPSTASGQYSVLEDDLSTPEPVGVAQLGYNEGAVNTDPSLGEEINLPALFPSVPIPNTTQSTVAGTVAYRWVTLTADVDTDAVGNGTGTETGTATFSVTNAASGESYTLGTIDNSVIDDPLDGTLIGQDEFTEQGPVNMSGRVTLTLIDFFTSVATNGSLSFVVFDNFSVTSVPDSVLEGDYNDDGVVDAADYTVYRDAEAGVAGVVLQNETDNAGTIDAGDYNAWANNFGATASSAVAVPEPSSVTLIFIAAGLAARRRR